MWQWHMSQAFIIKQEKISISLTQEMEIIFPAVERLENIMFIV